MSEREREPKSDRLSLRISRRQRAVITEAADASEKDLTSFVLEAALVSAQQILADRRMFSIDRKKWERFLELLDRPAASRRVKPRLHELLKQPSVLEARRPAKRG